MTADAEPTAAVPAPAADQAAKTEAAPTAVPQTAPETAAAPAAAPTEAAPAGENFPIADENAAEDDDDEPVTGHIPMASRLSLISWGDGSAPSMPAIDDSGSESGLGGAGATGGEGDADDGASDADSAYDSDRTSSILKSTTTSLRSSLYDYVEENGRTYHRYKEGKYPLPNDIQEQARLDLQHAIFLLMAHGKSYLAPIDKPKRVLDFATGTGIWAIEFALEFPESHIIGTDLSPIQPDFIPPNCTFEVDDAEDEWSFDQPFDYIHGRALVSCFRNPATVIHSAFASLSPGGILELQDGHFPIKFASPPPVDCALRRWFDIVTQGAVMAGRPWTNVQHYPRWMNEAGFENVTERKFYWPVNPWPKGSYYKTLGAYVQQDLLNGMEGLSLKLLGLQGWSYEDIQALLVEVRRDLLDTSIHAYIEVSITWGTRPKEGGEAAAVPEVPVPEPETATTTAPTTAEQEALSMA
ncbi:hypothetical protein Sste5346_005592 [Sporothrix stenoceras]|uniref:Methyltransferase domain-containing protein n=1 Tax=Sporothrix stenoceras TaxID=5173 RepID=A0ABR3Z3M5_9PEZI